MSKIITPEFRGSFVTLITPRAFNKDQAPKFSMVIPIDKKDKFWKKLDKAIEEAAMAKWGEIPKKMKTFIKDGSDEEDKYGWEDCFVITASNKTQPGILIKTDKGMEEVVDPEDIYSGAYYRASVRPYAYEFTLETGGKSKGVAISLDNVLKVGEGDKFTSKTSAQDDFKDYIDDEDWED